MVNNYTRYKFYVIGVGGTGSLLAREFSKLKRLQIIKSHIKRMVLKMMVAWDL